MSEIRVDIRELKNTIAKMNLAIENSKLNPKSGWIEVETTKDNKMTIKVANYDYYLLATVGLCGDEITEENSIHATVTAETFIPLVSKLEDEFVTISERMNALVFNTGKAEYTFPIIKEMGKVKSIDTIEFNSVRSNRVKLSGENVASVANSNAKGLVNAIFSRDIQQFVYFDNGGAITFTDNIYLNDFGREVAEGAEPEFKILLNATQAKLLKVFEGYEEVEVIVAEEDDYSSARKCQLVSVPDNIKLTLIVQSLEMTDKFPSIKLRNLASSVSETHAIINKKALEKALARLMVFDKKFDITVLNYSKFVWGEDSVTLVSIKNKNYEVVPYVSGTNTTTHESVIRFADVVNQLKAITTNEIDISYGDSPAIVINSDGLKQLIPEVIDRSKS